MIERIKNIGRHQEALREREPQVELAYQVIFEWGKLKVSQAATEAYGLVPQEFTPEQLGESAYPDTQDSSDTMPLTVWLISPLESAELHQDRFTDKLIPPSGASLINNDNEALIVAALNETRYAAAQNMLYEIMRESEALSDIPIKQIHVELPEGDVPIEDAMDRVMPAYLIQRLAAKISVAVTLAYTEHYSASDDRQLIGATTKLGAWGLAAAGVMVGPAILETGQVEAAPVGWAAIALMYTLLMNRRMLKAYAQYRTEREEYNVIISSGKAAKVANDIVGVH